MNVSGIRTAATAPKTRNRRAPKTRNRRLKLVHSEPAVPAGYGASIVDLWLRKTSCDPRPVRSLAASLYELAPPTLASHREAFEGSRPMLHMAVIAVSERSAAEWLARWLAERVRIFSRGEETISKAKQGAIVDALLAMGAR